MAKKPIDGFVPRRSPGMIGETTQGKPADQKARNNLRLQRAAELKHDEANVTLTPSSQQGLTRQDVDESLREIDNQPNTNAPQKHKRGGLKSRRRRIIKWIVILLVLLVVGAGIFLAVKALIAGGSVFKGDVFGLVQQKKLQQDANGRTNILLLGTSEDDPGHEGAFLTDSIMVLSVDQTNKNAYMVSIPRDLRVKYGMACNQGYEGKINEYFNCVNDDWNSSSAETERQTETRKFIGQILGLDLQYSAHVNYSVMRDVVQALGSITVDIEGSNGAPGILDQNFDWKCGVGDPKVSAAEEKRRCPPNGHFIEYKNGPTTLDAEHALYLAQARGDCVPIYGGCKETYGLGRSNFDREQNQQKIIMAIREKAMSAGTLTNLGKVTGLIDAMGKNLRTNFDTSEIRTLMSLAQDIQSSAIVRLDLQADGIMTGEGQPAAGLYDYTQLQAYIKKKIYATGISREDPHVIVLNASGVAGAAQVESDKLTALGMTVDTIGNAPSDLAVSTNMIYQVGKTAKKSTADKLAQLYGVKPAVQPSIPGVTVGDSTDYVIVLVTANTSATGNTTTP